MNSTPPYPDMKPHPPLTNTVANMETKPPPITEFMEGTAGSITPDSDPGRKVKAKEKSADKDWLSDELLSKLEARRPTNTFKAGDVVPPPQFLSAFTALFSPPARHIKGEYEYENVHQVTQAVRLVAHWYGFGIKLHGTTISCCCSLSSKQKAAKAKEHCQSSSTFAELESAKSMRNRESLSQINCPFFIKVSPKKVQGSSRETQRVRITAVCFQHNHPLNKDTVISSRMGCHQYSIPLQACITLVSLSRHGPIPTITLRGYLQDLYPTTVKVTATMVANLRVKLKKINIEFPKSEDVPGSSLRRLFDPSSLEVAQENVFDDPVMAKIYEEAMVDQLIGDDPNDFALRSICEAIKTTQNNGYDYRIYYGEDGRPRGVIQMTPAQRQKCQRYGDVMGIDAQLKRRNRLGWIYFSATGTNNNKKINNFIDSLTLSETDHFSVFAVRSMCSMAGRPLSTIKFIGVDGKANEIYLRKNLPGETFYVKLIRRKNSLRH